MANASVTRAFCRQMIRGQRIPLNLEYPRPNREPAGSSRDADAIIASGDDGYASAKDMFDAMGV